MRIILMFIFLKCGIFPAKCSDLKKWKDFAKDASRNAVERLYRFWSLCSNFEKKTHRDIEQFLRDRLLHLELPQVKSEFTDKYKDQIFWVHSFWNARRVFSYMRENAPTLYPCYVVDFDHRLRGIAINKDLILVGALNFFVSVEEAQRFYNESDLKPLTDEDAEILIKSRANVQRMMRAAGMSGIKGRYLLVSKETKGWIGYWLSKKNIFTSKSFLKGYFLLAKL